MAHKFDPSKVAILDSAERRQIQDPERLFLFLEIKEGLTAADIGCGTGYYTFPLADRVGRQGKVYAIDISGEMLDLLEKRMKERGCSNIELILSEEATIPLADTCVDLALIATSLHEMEQKEELLREVKRILKVGGQIINIDWEAKESPLGPPIEHRIPCEEAMALMSKAGFRDVKILPEIYPYHYVIQGIR